LRPVKTLKNSYINEWIVHLRERERLVNLELEAISLEE